MNENGKEEQTIEEIAAMCVLRHGVPIPPPAGRGRCENGKARWRAFDDSLRKMDPGSCLWFPPTLAKNPKNAAKTAGDYAKQFCKARKLDWTFTARTEHEDPNDNNTPVTGASLWRKS